MASEARESEVDIVESEDSNFVQKMRGRLPPTVVNCLLATGGVKQV